jgi:hypothetical protein
MVTVHFEVRGAEEEFLRIVRQMVRGRQPAPRRRRLWRRVAWWRKGRR